MGCRRKSRIMLVRYNTKHALVPEILFDRKLGNSIKKQTNESSFVFSCLCFDIFWTFLTEPIVFSKSQLRAPERQQDYGDFFLFNLIKFHSFFGHLCCWLEDFNYINCKSTKLTVV